MKRTRRSFALLGSVGLAVLGLHCSSKGGAPAPDVPNAQPTPAPAAARTPKLELHAAMMSGASNAQLRALADVDTITFDANGDPQFKVLVATKTAILSTPDVRVLSRVGSVVTANVTRAGLASLAQNPAVVRIEAVRKPHIVNEVASAESSIALGNTYDIASSGAVVTVPFTPSAAGEVLTVKMSKSGILADGGVPVLTSTIKICSDAGCAAPLAQATGNDAGGDARVSYTFPNTNAYFIEASAAAGQTGAFALTFIGDASVGVAFGTKAKATTYNGTGVIIGIVDTGIDWCHEDFTDSATGESRILSIWDQGLTAQAGETAGPNGAGVVYSNAQINAAKATCDITAVRHQDFVAHGTHCSGIAAGNGLATNDPTVDPPGRMAGASPGAHYVVVDFLGADVSGAQQDPVGAFQYIKTFAATAGPGGTPLPFVISNSWGDYGGEPQDGTTLEEQSLSGFAGPGAAITVAAGNNGYYLIHAHQPSTIPAIGVGDSFWLKQVEPCDAIPTDGGTDPNACLERYLSIWTEGTDTYDLTLTAPDGTTVGSFPASGFDPVNGNSQTVAGIPITVYGETAPDPNGAKNIYVEVGPQTTGDPGQTHWVVGLTRDSGSTGGGTWDAYVPLSGPDGYFPNYLEDAPGVGAGSSHITQGVQPGNLRWVTGTLGNPTTALGVISVAAMGASSLRWFDDSVDGGGYTEPSDTNYVFPELGNLAYYSSRGPARDGRILPMIAAPGTYVHSAASRWGIGYAFAQSTVDRDGQHVAFSGTSMATPGVTGVIAQILEVDPTNFPRPLLRTTAVHDSVTDDSASPNGWLNNGYGKADGVAAITALKADHPPTASALTIQPVTAVIGQSVTLSVTAHDPDGDGTLSEYLWDVNGDGFTDYFTTTNTVTFSTAATQASNNYGLVNSAAVFPDNPGPYTASVSVVDNCGRTATTTASGTFAPLADGGTDAGGDSGSATDSGTLSDSGSGSGGGDSGSGTDSGSATDSGLGGTDSGSSSGGEDSGPSGTGDSGPTPGLDASSEDGGEDGGPNSGAGNSSGCGCVTAGRTSGTETGFLGGGAALLGVLGIGLRRRRRAGR